MPTRSKSAHIFLSPEDTIIINEKNTNFIKDNKRSQIVYEKQRSKIKLVPAFSIQSMQKNSEVFTLPRKYTGIKYSKNDNMDDVAKSMINRFKEAYINRQLPLQIVDGVKKKSIIWNIKLEDLDMLNLKKLFQISSLGLPCTENFYETVALEAFESLICLSAAKYILFQILTEVVMAIRKALDYGNNEKKIKILNLIIKITKIKNIGKSLLPYYKQLLAPLRQPYSKMSFLTNGKETKNDSNYQLSHYIHKTLVALEESGGRNALVNICYVVPHYQSIYHYQ
uniref:Parkin co-regulated protein n=1 Tax=Parastrongyloides trichosuri TaxID=131310 RepID=A0A0N4ZAZ4_PARTI